MQNEITELRNQVRTLKRIVYGFGCLLVAGVVVSATSMQTVPDVIQAKKFEVVNGDGNAVVVLDSHILELEVPIEQKLYASRWKNALVGLADASRGTKRWKNALVGGAVVGIFAALWFVFSIVRDSWNKKGK